MQIRDTLLPQARRLWRERERVVTKITIQLYNVIYISFHNVNFDNVRERERER